ncbi:hypothetical protein MMC26_005374 [Xylographa opegraphella]|nr:hypothetical protein [Xylographa opegraphella]
MSHQRSSIPHIEHLITSITGFSQPKDSAGIEHLVRESLSVLKDSKSSRINQFIVRDRIAGLAEKFRVFNNEELADALHEKVEKLSKWNTELQPELLTLLLDLSEDPATRTKIEDLELLKQPPPLAPLTWSQILAEDPLDSSNDIWRTIDYAADSSEEDGALTPDRTVTFTSKPAFAHARPLAPAEFPTDFNIPIENELIQEITGAHFWKIKSASTVIPTEAPCLTETQLIREILFMLMGLPTTLFQKSDHGQLRVVATYRIQGVSTEALDDIISSFLSIGQQLADVYEWVRRTEVTHMLQTLQAVLRSKLQSVTALLTKIETRLLHPEYKPPVTLLSVLFEVQAATRPILSINSVISVQQTTPSRTPFAFLESLYDGICLAESTGDEDVYKFFGELFFPCLQTYLKLVSEWIEFGRLAVDDEVFFVMKTEEEPSKESLWSKQYMLRFRSDGALYAPHFLHLKVKKILTSGKSISFMRSLGLETPELNQGSFPTASIDFKFDDRLNPQDVTQPFPQRFDTALNIWVNSMHQSSSLSLREVMASRCGLWRVLDALEYIYLSRDGAITSHVAAGISSRFDKGKTDWNDQFVLTELFREAYGALNCVNTAQVFVRSKGDKGSELPKRQRSMGNLACLAVGYKLPWAVANIIRPDSTNVYQRVFVLLLQVLRAKEILSRKAGASLSVRDDHENMTAIILSLRHRLLWFFHTFHSYLTTTALSPACLEFRRKMNEAEDLDEMIAAHDAHVVRLENQCLLSGKLTSTHQAIVSMFDLAALFSDLRTSLDQKLLIRAARTRQDHIDNAEASSDVEDHDTLAMPFDLINHSQQLAQLRKLPSTFGRLLGIILVGLREANRSGSESCWGILIEELAIGKVN